MAHDDDLDLSDEPPAPAGDRIDQRAPIAIASSIALLIALLIALATGITYVPVLENGFTTFDDPQYIVDNPQVGAGLTLEGLRWAFTHAHSDNWHPLTWLSHMLDVELFGLDPRGHHAVGVALHAANAVLLFALLLRLTRRPVASALSALFFSLHPLRVESVAWAAERKDVLSGLFFLLTLIAYARYVERESRGRYALALVLFVLGLLSKPMLVTLPLLLLLLDRWPLERTTSLVPEARLWVEKLPFFALSLASAGITLWAQSIGVTVKSLEFISLGDRVLNAGTSLWAYLAGTLWPRDLAFFYPHPALVEGDAWLGFELRGALALVALVAITWGVLRRANEEPWWAVGWLWTLIALAPVIGIVQVGVQAHADRYTYLPTIGWVIALVFGVDHALRGQAERNAELARAVGRAVVGAALIAVVALALASARQVTVWQSSQRLYQHALEVTHGNYIAAFNLGALSGGMGDNASAIQFYTLALELRPDYAAAHSNLGVAIERIGRVDEAEEHYLEALRLEPRLAHAAINLGTLYVARGELDLARESYARAIDARPDLALPREAMGELEAELGNSAAAIAHFEAAVAIAPGAATLRTRLAHAYAMDGQSGRAREQYEAALERDPGQLAAMNALALLLATADEASLRNPKRAIELSRSANAATGGRNPTFLMTLALSHASAGDLDEARRQRDRSIGFAAAKDREVLRALFERHHPTRVESEPTGEPTS